MENKFLNLNNLISIVFAIFIAYAWWMILPNILEKVLSAVFIVLLCVAAYLAGTYFDESPMGINFKKSAERLDSEIAKRFKKIPVVSNPAFWLFVISAYVSWSYYQDYKISVSGNIFMIILLFINPFLDAGLFKITEPLRDKMFGAKSLKDKIVWRAITAVIVLIIVGPYLYFVYNILLPLVATPT